MNSTPIQSIRAIEILDSRGYPTIQTQIHLASGHSGIASVPSGASTGQWEALELRDGDPKRYAGKGVQRAVAYVNGELAQAVIGKTFDQVRFDQTLIDLNGTPNKARYGANAILSLSLAFARANADANQQLLVSYLRACLSHYLPTGIDLASPIVGWQHQGYHLPCPLVNVINGGLHANNRLDIQEFMIVPRGLPDFASAIQASAEVFYALKARLQKQGYSIAVGDEGGFAPDWADTVQAIEQLLEAIHQAGYQPGKDFQLALDLAASTFYTGSAYHLRGAKQQYTRDDWVAYCVNLSKQYPIFSLEDALSEEDDLGWEALTQTIGQDCQLVGDDVFVTQKARLARGIERKMANAILIKLNQVGTLSETLDTVALAQQSGYATVISHRSGETEDSFIADLAVACASGQIKTGSLCRSERTVKYNRLLSFLSPA